MPLLLDSSSVTVMLQPLLSVFALKPSSGNTGGICFIKNMDAMGKLLTPLMGPVLLLLAVCLALLIAKMSECRRSWHKASDESKFSSDATKRLDKVCSQKRQGWK